MRITLIFPLVCLSFITCRNKEKVADDATTPQIERAILENPSSWIRLTEREGKQIIFQRCDGNNTEIRVAKDSLYINWGEYEEFFSIVSIQEQDGKNIVTAKAEGDENERKFPVQMLDGEGREAKWYLSISDSTAALFVNKKFADEYEEVKQPCRECWGEDVCDEAEKKDSEKNQ